MRLALTLMAAVAAALVASSASAVAQGSDATIETTPLAPLQPRLPGGTVIAPDERTSPPGAVTPPGEDADRVLPPRPADEAVRPDEADVPGDGSESAAIGSPEATLPTSEGEPGGEGQGEPLQDLFKKVPPGTGGLGPREPQLIEPVAREDAPGALLRQLDKLTGQIETFELAAGQEAVVQRLRIALTECREPVDGTTSDHIAFLRIWDTRRPDDRPVFSGWMFADSPALSAMDHPRYDLWVIRCTTASGSSSSVNR